MVTLAFTVFEDDAERGYHFRQQPGDEAWAALVKQENGAVRSLSDGDLQARFRVVPMGDGSTSILASSRVELGNRSSIRTVSLRLVDPTFHLRWVAGMSDLMLDAMNSTQAGGEVTFDLQAISLPSDLVHHLPAPGESATHRIAGRRLDPVMALWCMLAPDARIRTEVQTGPEMSDVLAPWCSAAWHVDEASADTMIPFTSPHIDTEMLASADKEALCAALPNACAFSDTTGMLGDDWWLVVASDMAERGHPVVAGDHLSTRLTLSDADQNVERRRIWRQSAVETYAQSLDHRTLHAHRTILTGAELEQVPSHHRAEVVHAVLLPESVALQPLLMRHLGDYAPRLTVEDWRSLCQAFPWDTWLQEPRFSAQLQVMNHHHPTLRATFHEHVLVLAQQDARLGQAYLKALSSSRVSLHLEQDLDVLLRMPLQANSEHRAFTSGQPTLLHDHRVLHGLAWVDQRATARRLAQLHVFQLNAEQQRTASLISMHRSYFNDHSGAKDGLWAAYVEGLEAEHAKPSRQTPLKLALDLAPTRGQGSLWFEAVMMQSTLRPKVDLLQTMRIEPSQIADALLKEMYTSGENKLRGFPSRRWMKHRMQHPDAHPPWRQHAELVLKPSFSARIRKMAHRASMLASAALGVCLVAIGLTWNNPSHLPAAVSNPIQSLLTYGLPQVLLPILALLVMLGLHQRSIRKRLKVLNSGVPLVRADQIRNPGGGEHET